MCTCTYSSYTDDAKDSNAELRRYMYIDFSLQWPIGKPPSFVFQISQAVCFSVENREPASLQLQMMLRKILPLETAKSCIGVTEINKLDYKPKFPMSE